MRFSRQSRLSHRREFLAVKAAGVHKAGNLFVLNALLPRNNPLFAHGGQVKDRLVAGESGSATKAFPEETKPTICEMPHGRFDPHQLCRLGIITTRRVGNAVERVRMRRLVRESFRAVESSLVPGVWIVVVARPGMVGAKFIDVQSEWLRLGKRLSIIAVPS